MNIAIPSLIVIAVLAIVFRGWTIAQVRGIMGQIDRFLDWIEED